MPPGNEDYDQTDRPSGGEWLPASRWRRVFAGEAHEVPALRRFLGALLPECPSRDDVMYVATELATNAVCHTASGRGGRFALEVVWHSSVVHVAIGDGGALSGPRVVDDPLEERGRGLLLVRSLSLGFGTCGGPGGRLVWADIPWSDPEDPAFGRWALTVDDDCLAGAPIWFGRPISPWGLACCERSTAVPSAAHLRSVLNPQPETAGT